MCRVFRIALLGALLTVPLAAAEPAKTSPAACPTAFNPAATLQLKTVCPQSQPGCEACEPTYDNCGDRQYNSIAFVNQKPNYVCVYVCNYTDTCYDSSCGRPNPTHPTANFRVRSQPYEFPWGGCPAANLSFCSSMEVDY